MNKKKTLNKKKSTNVKPSKKVENPKTLEEQIKKDIEDFKVKANAAKERIEKLRKRKCYILWHDINAESVDDVYYNLRKNYNGSKKLDILIHSAGGDIDAAYNIACTFKKFAKDSLTFLIPRWAKSAATLIVCAGEEIYMTQIAELGPLDPQIMEINRMEDRVEQFSPLHIKTTLEMIRQEYEKGSKDLAEALTQRLQFPLTLGKFTKSLDIGRQYVTKLLSHNMNKLNKKPEDIAKTLTEDYADHGFCINYEEAEKIGLNVKELNGQLLNLTLKFYDLYKSKEQLKTRLRKIEMSEFIKNLPNELKKVAGDTLIKSEEKNGKQL